MVREFFTRDQVVALIDNLMEHADVVADAIQSENPKYSGDDMLAMSEDSVDISVWDIPKRSDYDKFTSTKHDSICLQRAADDEPIFALRAKDPTAPELVEEWCSRNSNLQPIDKVGGAMILATKMREWRLKNIKAE